MDSNELFRQFFYSDFFDILVSERIKDSILRTVKDIKMYENRDDLEVFQKKDLQDWIKDVECLTHTYIYFSGDWNFDPYKKDDEND